MFVVVGSDRNTGSRDVCRCTQEVLHRAVDLPYRSRKQQQQQQKLKTKEKKEHGRAGPVVSVRITAVPRLHAPVTHDSVDSSLSLITGKKKETKKEKKEKLPRCTLNCRFLQQILLTVQQVQRHEETGIMMCT